MGLESATYLQDLDAANPVGAVDPKSGGDDHLRLIKAVLKATFPNLGGRAFRTQDIAGTYTVAVTDNMTVLNCTSGFTLNYGACATLGNGHITIVRANGGNVTIDPNGAELVNGVSTLLVLNGTSVIVFCNGTSLFAFTGGGSGGGATGAGGDQVFNENQLVVTTSYTLTSGKSAVSVGPITINSGVTVTIPSGKRWVIL